MSGPRPEPPARLARLLPWAAVASAVPAAWPFFGLPAWSTRARILVGGVVGRNLLLVAAAALLLAAALALKPRVGRLSVPLGAALAAGLALAIPARILDLSTLWQLAGRLLGCAVLIVGALRPSLRSRKALGSGLAAAGSGAIAALLLAPTVRPDLVLITVDTLRADRINASDYADLAPNIQRFARGAVRFTHAWSTATWTVPAMASIFTGVHPAAHGADSCTLEEATPLARSWFAQNHGLQPNPLFRTASRSLETLGGALSRGGYATGGFSTSHFVSMRTRLADGFDWFDVEGDRDERATDRALEWLRGVRRATARPFFLFVHEFAPHRAYEPPRAYMPPEYRYSGPLPPWRSEVFDDVFDGEPVAQRVMRRQVPLPEADLRHIEALYDGEVRWVDHNVGRILDEVDGDPSGPSSLVALTADHGDFLGEKLLFDHGHFPYDPVVRVPLLTRFPVSWRVAPNSCGSPVSSNDLYPTLLRAAGVSPQHPMTAEDLFTTATRPRPKKRFVVMDGKRNSIVEILFGSRFSHSFRAITDGRWKLLRREDGALELYDLDNDPGEATNLAEVERRTAASLLRTLEDFEAHEIKYPPERPPSFTPEEIRQLRALGYLR